MTPYYQDEAVTIYHGDCREIFGSLVHFDLALTDPPYGLNEAAGRNKSRSKMAIAKDYGTLTWDAEAPDEQTIQSVIDTADHSILWGGNYFAVRPRRGWLVWDKCNGASDFADCELAWTNLETAVRKFTYRWAGMLQEDMGAKEFRSHPTQKPEALMRWCIGLAGPDVRTVLDPFMGSGTTLFAAKRLGLTAVGIDREESYCEIAANRCRQGALTEMFR